MQLKFAGKSDVGKKRANNQDSFIINDRIGLFAVADGMGGHSGGEVASAVAVKTLEKVFQDKSGDIPAQMMAAVNLCNRTIFEQAEHNPNLHGMGTTLTAMLISDQWVNIGHVGDSRCYVFRDGQLFQITEDHSHVYELLKAGLISESNAGMVQKNVITRSVGYEADVQIDLMTRPRVSGDRYLICSDGLSGMVSNLEIARVLQNFDVPTAVANLIDLANIYGGEDNVSVILIEIQ